VSHDQLTLFDRPFPARDTGADGAPCGDCGRPTLPRADRSEWYMVHKHVWLDAQPWNDHGGVVGYLCVGCLERRLGRRLGPADFTDAPVNEPAPWGDSFRLAERKGHR
jgi:hypothetical protein